MSDLQAHPLRLVISLWLLTVAFAVVREAGNPKNAGRPLPRPCVLLGSAAGYTVLAVLAELWPQVFVPVTLGITVGAFVAPVAGNRMGNLGVLSGAINRLNAISGGA